MIPACVETPRIAELRSVFAAKMAELEKLEQEMNDPNCPRHKKDLFASGVTAAKALNRDLKAALEHQTISEWANKPQQEPTRPGHWIDSAALGPRTGANGSYRSLFGEPTQSGFKSFDDFLETLHSRVGDPRIVRAIGEGRPGDGGVLVPTEYSAQLLDAALEQEVVRPRATVYPMISNTRKVPGTVIGSHASTLFGGVAGGFVAEGAEMTESDPRFRSIELVARKLACYSLSSLEWWDDAPNAAGVIQRILARAIAWFADEAYIRGSGSGGPLGILNSPCLVTQAKENSQAADTINSLNLNKMLARLAPGSFARAVWLCHPTAFAQILGIVENYGTEGLSANNLFRMNPDGSMSLLTRPLIVTEHCAIVGDLGDILLADFSQYAIGLRGELRLDTSEHVKFSSATLAHRAILRCDGMPTWDEPLTLRDASTTVSPFVALEARE